MRLSEHHASTPRRPLSTWQLALAGWLALTVLLSAQLTFALDPNRLPTQYLFDRSGRDSGLPSDTVWVTREGPRGYLWIGTQNGLVRYDGSRFTVFNQQTHPAFKSNDVRDLEWTPSGELWIGTYGGGLVVMRDNTFTTIDAEDGLAGNLVYDIHRSSDGALWIGTVSGVSRYENDAFQTWTAENGLASSKTFKISEAKDGTLWFSTLTAGLSYYDGEEFRVVDRSNGLDSNQIHLLQWDDELGIIAGTSTGSLYQLSPGSLPTRLPWSGVAGATTTLFDRDGNRWIGTYGKGLRRLSPDGREELIELGTDSDSAHIFDLMEDANGNVWVSTPHGLHRIRDSVFIPIGKPEGLDDSTFVVTGDSEGNVWAGTERSGLFKVDKDGHISQPYPQLTGVSVSALLPRSNGELWVGTFGQGVARIHNDRVEWIRPEQGLAGTHVVAMAETRDNAVWVATNTGSSRWQENLDSATVTTVPGLEGIFIRHILEGRDGSLWLSSNKGLYKHSNGKLLRWGVRDGLASDFISSTYEDERGVLWIATRDGGIARLDGDQLYSFAKRGSTLPLSSFAILEDPSRNLWISSTRGLVRVPRGNLDAIARGEATLPLAQTFDEASGFRSAQFRVGFQPAAWRAQDNKMWFATTRGLSSFDPLALSHEHPTPQTVIEAVRVNGEAVPLEGPITLPATVRRLELDYSAPALNDAHSVGFRYKLSNGDQPWEDVGALRTAYFTSLPPGAGVFRVQAQYGNQAFADADTQIAQLSFYRTPHWYETAWAVLLCCIAAALLLGGYQWFLTRNARLRELELVGLVDQRTDELREALERVEANSRIDSLTGVANRRHLEEQLSYVWSLAARSKAPVSLIMLDIDKFKEYNDTLGHNAGDACLRAIARSISGDLLRENDMVARYGGEEFLIVLYDSDAAGALTAARRIMHRIDALDLPHPASSVSTQVTVSIGYATTTVDQISDPHGLIEQADQALYAAKHDGRNRISAAK